MMSQLFAIGLLTIIDSYIGFHHDADFIGYGFILVAPIIFYGAVTL
jgi:hypothetical protein